jgi:hypothetical protein
MSGPFAALQSIDWSKPQEELDRLKGRVDAWTKAQPPYVEVGLATLGGSTQGAVLGGVMGAVSTQCNICNPRCCDVGPTTVLSSTYASGFLMQMTKLDPEGAGKLLVPPTGGNDAVSR